MLVRSGRARVLELCGRGKPGRPALDDLLAALEGLLAAVGETAEVAERMVSMLDLVLRRKGVAESLPPRLRPRVAANNLPG